jgi:cytochrome c oxidase cbb3-type subunit I/II
MMTFGMMYWMVPQIWGRQLAHPKWASHHFWLATIGIVIYTVAMWAAGLMEGLQWRALNDAGQLANPIFLDITNRLDPFLWLRFIGGSMYLVGAVMMAINFWQTIRGSGEPAGADAVAAGAD